MDFTNGLAQEVAKLPAELQPILVAVVDKVAEIETKTAGDIQAIAKQVIDALVPQVQAVTQTANAGISETLALIRRLDGATITIRLAPDANLIEEQPKV
jgi:predicted metal-dependent phosphoesterase TrpH